MTWQPSPLPAHLLRRGVPTRALVDELQQIIEDAIANQPRTLQRKIGPSEVGNPCARRIGYKLLDAPRFNYRVNWKAFIGTAVHALLQDVLDAWNLAHCAGPEWAGQERFYTEQKVTAGQILGDDIDGSTDVYDRVTCTVIDWKIVGPSALQKYRRHGPGDQYRVQGHAYGAGWIRAGLPVDNVMILFLPRNADLHNLVAWSEPFDPTIAADAFTRASGIATAVQQLGQRALEVLPTAEAYCTFCDFYKPGSTDLTAGCPGDPAAQSKQPAPALKLTR